MNKQEQPEEGPTALEDLERSYREAEDPVERSHYQIVWLLARGKATRVVAEVTGYSARWVREIARRHRELGAEGLGGDQRHHNPGGAERALLTPEQREELRRALQAPPEDGGLWSSRKVAKWIEAKTGRRGVRAQRGWEYLRRVEHTPQVPRPTNAEADPEEQEAFKKSSPSG
jgi:transposase